MKLKALSYRLLGKGYTWLAYQYRQVQTYCYSVLHPYHYDASRYEGTFLTDVKADDYSEELVRHVERVIYIFWTGDNEITPNRMEGIRSLEAVCGVRVQLITPKNLGDYIKADDPLPEAYQWLSYVHRADYLRAYFMYHYGGGYADIKTYYESWMPAFEKLEQSDAYVMGYPEVGFWGAACHDIDHEALHKDLFTHWRYLVGNGAYICRAHSPLTYDWYHESKRRVEKLTPVLRAHPAKDAYGRNDDYPIKWSGILGSIFHPLCLKYHDKLLKDKALMPSFKNYR